MQAVIAAERQLGFEPSDVSADNRGYDVESRIPGTGKLRFLEVDDLVAIQDLPEGAGYMAASARRWAKVYYSDPVGYQRAIQEVLEE